MTDQDSKSDQTFVNDGMKLRSENIAFAPDELVVCSGCGRNNPPNRPNCIYCSHELDVSAANLNKIVTDVRPLESWEPGFNVIVRSCIGEMGPNLNDLAMATGLDHEVLATMARLGVPTPVVRVGSEKAAGLVADEIRKLGADAIVISDQSLMPDRLPVRLREISFREDELLLTDFNGGKTVAVQRRDLKLLVPGLITEYKVDVIEKKKRGKESTIIDQIETGNDEAVLDLYTASDPVGYRVLLAGFDYSCLGEDKGLLAVENIRLLLAKLNKFAPEARVVSGYRDVRSAISAVWPVDERKDSRGMQRSGFAKRDFGNTLSTSNIGQFNRYSRLQWHLL